MNDKRTPVGRIPEDRCYSPIELINKVVVCDADHDIGALTQGFENADWHQASGGKLPGEIEWHMYWRKTK